MSQRALAWAATILVLASQTFAQSLTGTIAGAVRDPQGAALADATLSLSGKTGSTHTTTDGRGSYRFPAVEPGRYELRAEAPGFRPRVEHGIALSIGERLTLDFSLELASLAENVEVAGESPVIDVHSSATRTGLTQDLLFQLPLGRFVPTLISATPGVNGGSTGFTTGDAERGSSGFGGGELGNALLVDGVDTRDPGDEGKWLSIGYNTLEEVQVLGPGVPAEYGAFTGAVFNAIRRSGGNRFEGLFEVRSTWEGLASDNVDAELLAQNPAIGDPAVTTGLLDLNAQFRGPIQKDELFFLLSGQRAKLETDPSGPRASADTLDYRLDAKLTWLPGSQDHVTVGLFHNREDISGQPGVPATVATDDLTSSWHKADWNWYGHWRRVFGTRTLLEVKYTGWSGVVEDRPKVAQPLRYDLATGGYSGGSGSTLTASRHRHQANASLSHHVDDFVGSHDVKFGVEVERGFSRNDLDLVGGFGYFDVAGQPYLQNSFGLDVPGHAERESVYAQDAWRAGDRLTLNLGIRFDNYRGRGDSEALYRAHGLAPRVGLAFDLSGDHRTVLKASFGRYYEALPVSYFEAALPGREDFVFYRNTGSGLIEVRRIPLSVPAQVDPDIRHPHVDEVTTGFERTLGKRMRFSAVGIWRRSGDFVSVVTPDGRFVPVETPNLLTGAPITVYGWADPTATSGFVTNPDGFDYLAAEGGVVGTAEAFRRYKGLVLVLSRRLAGRWQAQVSYVLSKAEGTVDNDYFESLGGPGPFTSPNRALTNADGLLTHDARHELKILGSYQIPRIEVAVSGFFRAVSGTTYTPFQDLPGLVAPFQESVRLEPRGSRRTPTRTVLDLRVEKVFGVGRGRVGVFADLLNAFNASTVVAVQDRVPSVSIPGFEEPIAFGAPSAILPARQVILGARFSF
ncbi:MAG TPA: TonB-dependent receptor [Vicinamibacteria bacterium]|nr:TonB-dependent receptor [Vicinamibacteria bacterium]